MKLWGYGLVLLLATATGWAKAQNMAGFVKGTVVAEGCIQHLAGVRIDLESENQTRRGITRTNPSGYFELDVSALPSGRDFALHFSKPGFATKTKVVNCAEDDCANLNLRLEQPPTPVTIHGRTFSEHLIAQRSHDCSTVFVLPHAVASSGAQNALTPGDIYILNTVIRTRLQALDIQPPEVDPPDDVHIVMLQGDEALEAGRDRGVVHALGQQLEAMAMFYGILRVNRDPAGNRIPVITSTFLPVTSLKRFRPVDILRGIPLQEFDTKPQAHQWVIQRLTRHALFALVGRAYDHIKKSSGHPENFTRLQRLRAYVLAERKLRPQEAQTSQTVEHRDAALSSWLLSVIEGEMQALETKSSTVTTVEKKGSGS